MISKNIIPLAGYTNLDGILTKQIREEANNKFYKKIFTLRSDRSKFNRLSPVKKIKKNFSLPKLRLNNINNKEKDCSYNGKLKIFLSKNEKFNNKIMSYEEQRILNFYENSILSKMKKRPKRINDIELNKYKFLFLKSKENYRRIEEKKLNRENSLYKKIVQRFSNNYANFSNKKIMTKSFLDIRKKLGINNVLN